MTRKMGSLPMRSHRPRRLLLVLVASSAPVLASVALAQTKARAPTKPTPAVADAEAPSSPLNPEPAEQPRRAAAAAAAPVDHDRLLADLAALRARVTAVSESLYRSRISVGLEAAGARTKIARLTVSLDDSVVFTAPPSFSAAVMTQVHDRAVAPGRHAVTVDVDRDDARDEALKTSQRSRFIVDVPRDHKVDVQVSLADESARSGAYDLRVRVDATAKPVGR